MPSIHIPLLPFHIQCFKVQHFKAQLLPEDKQFALWSEGANMVAAWGYPAQTLQVTHQLVGPTSPGASISAHNSREDLVQEVVRNWRSGGVQGTTGKPDAGDEEWRWKRSDRHQHSELMVLWPEMPVPQPPEKQHHWVWKAHPNIRQQSKVLQTGATQIWSWKVTWILAGPKQFLETSVSLC